MERWSSLSSPIVTKKTRGSRINATALSCGLRLAWKAAAKFGAGTLWPTDLRQRAGAERWMDWQLTTLSAPGWRIFLGLVPTKLEQRDMAAIAAANERFTELWTIVDKVLATRKFVAAHQLTIGDIPMGIAAYRWFAIPVERDHHPNSEAWYGRLTERPAFKKNVMTPLL
jgi:glutathione S-transferase